MIFHVYKEWKPFDQRNLLQNRAILIYSRETHQPNVGPTFIKKQFVRWSLIEKTGEIIANMYRLKRIDLFVIKNTRIL